MTSAKCMEHHHLEKPLRTVIIGLGSRGSKHLAVARACRAIEVVAVVDTDETVLAGAGKTAPNRFTSVPLALASSAPELALIAVPHDAYANVLAECFNAGVSCLKEKPLGRTASEGRAIADMAKRSGRLLIVAAQRRYGTVYDQLIKLRNAYGPPITFEYVYMLGIKGELGHDWRGDKRVAGGGAILDMGYHVTDVLTRLAGVPTRVSAAREPTQSRSFGEVEDGATLLLEYGSTTQGVVLLSRRLGPTTERATFWFDGCTASLADGVLTTTDGDEVEQVAQNATGSELMHAQLHSFVEDHLSQVGDASDLEHDNMCMAATELCYAALGGR